MGLLINILEQGLIFAIVSIGVFITYKILDFPDLSVDGTFPLGASITALCLLKGVNPFMACFIALLLGALAGLVTGILHVKFKITNLLSGILVMTALYSVNLRIMGKSNIPFFNLKTIFSNSSNPLILITGFAIISKLVLDLFLKTKAGFLLRAVGDNENIVNSLGVNKNSIKVLGIMLSNALVALAGSLMCQYQGFSDVGMGTGVVVMGLASVILGESVLGKLNFMQSTTMVLFGAIFYKAAIALALQVGFNPTDLKLITALIVVLALSLKSSKFNISFNKNTNLGGDSIAKNSKSMQNV